MRRPTRSARLFTRALHVIPGGVDSPVRAFSAVGGGPLFVNRASGSTIEDVDGRRYIDYVMSWGPLIHGHAPRGLLRALSRAARGGTSFGAPTSLEVELAESLDRNGRDQTFSFRDGGLIPVSSSAPDAALAWCPDRGWQSAIDPGDPRGQLLDLYLPLCSATRRRPIAIGHLGQSLDGFIATESGDSQFVTGHANVVHMHWLRGLCDAIVVGAGAQERACVQRRAPWIAIEQELREVAMREDRIVALRGRTVREPTQEQEQARALTVVPKHFLRTIPELPRWRRFRARHPWIGVAAKKSLRKQSRRPCRYRLQDPNSSFRGRAQRMPMTRCCTSS